MYTTPYLMTTKLKNTSCNIYTFYRFRIYTGDEGNSKLNWSPLKQISNEHVDPSWIRLPAAIPLPRMHDMGNNSSLNSSPG